MEELYGATSIRVEDIRRFHLPPGKTFLPKRKAASGRYVEICPDLASSELPIREIEELVQKLKSLLGVDCINVCSETVTVAKFPPFGWEDLVSAIAQIITDFLKLDSNKVKVTKIGRDRGVVPLTKPSA